MKHYAWILICNIYGYIFIDGLGLVLFYILGHGKIDGLENLPEGSFVLVANHTSYADWIVLHAISRIMFKRRITFLAKKKLFQHYWWRFAMAYNKCIYVDQDKPNKNLLKEAKHLLQTTDNILGIFPEGTRSGNGMLLKASDGATRIAISSGRPILPIGLNGFYDMWPRHKKLPKKSKLTIKIGKPLYLSKALRSNISEATKQIMIEITKLTGLKYNF